MAELGMGLIWMVSLEFWFFWVVFFFFLVITLNPPVVCPKITLPIRGLKSVTLPT